MDNQLRRDLGDLQRQIEIKQSQLRVIEKNCIDGKGHEWGDVEFNPIYRKGYTIPSDTEQGIYLGVDTRHSSIDVPSSTTKRWSRTCKKAGCGTVQSTEQTKKQHVAGPIPGTSGELDVPAFPNH